VRKRTQIKAQAKYNSPKEVGASLVAHAKATTTEDPRERALDHPTVPAQPLGRVDPPTGDPWRNAASTETTSEGREIIGLVGVQLGWALPRRPGLPRGSMIGGMASSSGRKCVES
jgi:hypothetical protein